ncbi:Na+/H+ antiporter subunit E [Colwellia echini]|uniref:Na+/H+ antiporter subunit E n=1 Tax=Colwellia echini TaxID=1982103 RepID=A0ABY3MZ32_9GAMM|nr:Na+/H+ antiporter subunit E [Colwellia echini]TYK66467.1 Na+/H+ antiporter subunit E [Colwellia echini]
MRLDTRFKWLPAPLLSISLFFAWLILNNSISNGQLVLAVIVAVVIPWVTNPFRVKQPRVIKKGLAIRHLFLVLYDIITANFQVAILILGPTKKLNPGFVKVPLDLTHTTPITLLASTVSLTPGTVSAEVYPWQESLVLGQEPEQRYLLIHVLNLTDEQALIDSIKQRYEAPLKEIFQC